MPDCLLKSFYVLQQSRRITTTWCHLNFKVYQSVVVKCCLIRFLFACSWFLMRVSIFSYVYWPVVFTHLSNACLYLCPYFIELSVVVIGFFMIFLPYFEYWFSLVMCFAHIWHLIYCLQLSSQEKLYFKK